MKVIIIGGGPAGMMAAIQAAKEKNEVILLEKKERCGTKLLITGKGRCNITSSIPIEEFVKNIPGNGKFLYSALEQYTNLDIIYFLQEQGVEVKEERGNRIFPVTDRSQSVLQAFLRKLEQEKVEIRINTEVKEIIVENGIAKGVKTAKNEKILGDKIILATGGKSYPQTGSTGDGYKMAERIGHHVTKIFPSLVPMCASDDKEKEEYTSLQLCKDCQGLSLKNVAIMIRDETNYKKIYEDFGEMLFTHFGVSGPTILSASAHLLRYPHIQETLKKGKIVLSIDLKPALSQEKLENRILRDFEKYKNKEIKNSLQDLLPQKLIMPIIYLSNIPIDKKVNHITKQERKQLVTTVKQLPITLTAFRPIQEAIVTAGGIDIKEINPKTMESKLIKNLYFAGEIIDVDAYTGGFNLQIAYSTGYVAGKT